MNPLTKTRDRYVLLTSRRVRGHLKLEKWESWINIKVTDHLELEVGQSLNILKERSDHFSKLIIKTRTSTDKIIKLHEIHGKDTQTLSLV